MRLRNIPGADEVIQNCDWVIKKPVEKKGKWNTIFGNDNPIHIEVGMGKGQFITEMAKRNPQVNYIGIERYTSVLLRAVQKREQLPDEDALPNLFYLCVDASELPEIFAKDEVAKIYLNFSDPWPKDRHARRRLPSKEFLARYDQILVPEKSNLKPIIADCLILHWSRERRQDGIWMDAALTFITMKK